MTTMEIGKELVALCKQGKNQEALDLFYFPNVENVEPCSMPGMEQTQTGGIAKIKGKINGGATTIKSTAAQLKDPNPHGDRFVLLFKYNVTPKHTRNA